MKVSTVQFVLLTALAAAPVGAQEKPGTNEVLVRMSSRARDEERLVSSTVRLLSTSRSGYAVVVYGQNHQTLRNLRHRVTVADASGHTVAARTERAGAFTHVTFEGRGRHALTLR